MPSFYGAIDLQKNELRQAVVQNLASAPPTPVKGQLYFDSGGNILYWYNGTGWVAAQGGAGAVPATTVTTQAVGDAPVVGTATTYAREDHKHGREAFGAVTAQTTFGAASSNGSATTVTRSDHTHGTPVHDAAAHNTISLSALAAPTGNLPMGGVRITGLGDPISATDAATKQSVDAAVAGLSWKDPARVATTANISLSGTQTIDGVTLSVNDRVLVKNQSSQAQNGLYSVQSGAWTRTTDADANAEIDGMAVLVQEGTTQADTQWVLTTNPPIAIGGTALTFTQFGGTQTYVAGAGLTLTANSFDVGAGTGITVAADSVAVDTAVIATVASVNTGLAGKAGKFAGALTGTASPETVTHNLNTRDVQVTVLNGSTPYTAVEVDWDATTVNTVTIRYSPNLGAGYRCVVMG